MIKALKDIKIKNDYLSLKNIIFFNSFNDLKKSYVETRKFDDFFNPESSINLCKIDTQGEYLNVL